MTATETETGSATRRITTAKAMAEAIAWRCAMTRTSSSWARTWTAHGGVYNLTPGGWRRISARAA